MVDPLGPKPRRWRWIILALLVLLLLGAGEYYISRAIATKLRDTANGKLDAELRLGTVIYVPPMGAWVWNAQLVRVGQPIVQIPRAMIHLAKLPLRDQPIIISSLTLEEPRLNLSPGAFRNIMKPGAQEKAPRKLSGMLQLKRVRVRDARISYSDPNASGPPTVWRNLSLDAETVQQSPSLYALRFGSRADPLGDASAAGTIDVDELMLNLQTVAVKMRAEPDPSSTPLPQGVQEFLKKYRIHGGVAIYGKGKVLLRDPQQSSFTLDLALQDAIAQIPPNDLAVDRVAASIVCSKRAGEPVNVRVDQFELSADDKQVFVDAGELQLDAASSTWKLTDLDGYIIARRPLHPTTQPKLKFNRYQFSGRCDFTAALSGAFGLRGKDPWQAIEHEIVVKPRGASFLPKDFAHRVEDINGGEIRLANGTIVFHELAGTYGGDRLRLRAARLPVKGLPRLAQWREISGTVTFHQPLRRYSPTLDKIFDALNPDGQFVIAGSWTNERISDETRKRSYDLIVSSDTGSFALAQAELPLKKIRGDATVTPAGVVLHGAQAELLGGTVAATGRWTRGDADSYDGDLTLRDVDLAQLRQLHGSGNSRLKGRVFAQATVFGTTSEQEKLKGLRAGGEVEIERGELFHLPVLKDIFANVKGMSDVAMVSDAAAVFDIADGQIRLRDAAVSAPALGLQGTGTLGLDGTVDLKVVAAPLSDWRAGLKETNVPLVSDVAGELAGAIQKLLNAATGTLLYEFRVSGDLKKVQIVTVPTPVLTDTAAFVFEKMLAPPKKGQRPIELLRHQPSPPPRAETR